MFALCEEVFSASSCAMYEKIICQTCNMIYRISQRPNVYLQVCGTGKSSVQAQFLKSLDCVLNEKCVHCDSLLNMQTEFNLTMPPLIVLSLTQGNLKITPTIEVSKNGRKAKYHLKGIIYHGGYHFTARIVTSQKDVWYHDGMTTAKECKYEGKLCDFHDIRDAEGRKVSTVIYSL
jgi:hypothetical protein